MQAQHYLNLQVDNDLILRRITIILVEFLDYGYQLPAKDTAALVQKCYLEAGARNLYPSKRYSTNTAEYDYPYSGYLYLQYGQEYRTKLIAEA